MIRRRRSALQPCWETHTTERSNFRHVIGALVKYLLQSREGVGGLGRTCKSPIFVFPLNDERLLEGGEAGESEVKSSWVAQPASPSCYARYPCDSTHGQPLNPSRRACALDKSHQFKMSVDILTLYLSQGLLLLTSVVAVAVFYFFYAPTDEDFKSDTNSCRSPDCLRCSRRWQRKELLVRLKDFESCRKTRPDDLIRLYDALEMELSLPETRQPTVFYLPKLLPQVPWHDNTYVTELEALSERESFRAIKSEFLNLYKHHGDLWARNTVASGTWRVCHLYNQGRRADEVCNTCPRTAGILEKFGPFRQPCAFTSALFSVMDAGTHITPHCGPTNCRLRCHLPLSVPNGCVLRVNGEQRVWEEGRPVLFDDSFIHEAWNRATQGYRAILMVDLWHPGLTEVEKEALLHLFSP